MKLIAEQVYQYTIDKQKRLKELEKELQEVKYRANEAADIGYEEKQMHSTTYETSH